MAIGREIDAYVQGVCSHIEKNVGRIRYCFHDQTNDPTHVDVQIAHGKNEWAVVSTGVGLQQTVDKKHVELAMFLPESWGPHDVENPRMFWPIAWLRFIGRHALRSHVPLLPGDAIAIPHDPTLRRPTKFGGVLVLPTDFDGKPRIIDFVFGKSAVQFLALCPLFDSELQYVRENGEDPNDGTMLPDFFEGAGISPYLAHENRAPIVPLSKRTLKPRRRD